MMPSFGLVVLGMAVGLHSGMLGIGGGILLVPGLMLLFGFSQPQAQGTSLAVLVPPVGIFAAMVYYQHRFIQLNVVACVAAGFLLGAYLGAKLVPHVPIALLRPAFGALLLYLGFTFLLDAGGTRTAIALPAGVGVLCSAVVARLVRRRPRPPAHHEPPGADVEYHI